MPALFSSLAGPKVFRRISQYARLQVLSIALGNEASEEMIEVLKQHGAPEGQELPF